MADLAVIRTALAARINSATGLRTLAEPKDQVNPPVAIVLTTSPLVRYGDTIDGTLTMRLRVLILISDAAPTDKVQRALDAYLGIGAGEAESIAGAIQGDPTLGQAVHYCVPLEASPPQRIEYANQTYFGAWVNVEIGTI